MPIMVLLHQGVPRCGKTPCFNDTGRLTDLVGLQEVATVSKGGIQHHAAELCFCLSTAGNAAAGCQIAIVESFFQPTKKPRLTCACPGKS